MPTIQVIPGSLELQAIADTLGKSRKVVVVTGAGISTNCGIPDFRSENGLYSLIQAQFDAAAKNPPWEETNTHDIDDRPKKRRKPWYFYEVVAPGGQVVDTVGGGVVEDSQLTPNGSFPNSTSTSSSRSRSASVSKPRINLQSFQSGLRDLSSTLPDFDEALRNNGDLKATQDCSLQSKTQLSNRSRSGSPLNLHTLPQGNPSNSSDLSDPPSDIGEPPWSNSESKHPQHLPRLRPKSLAGSHTNSPTNISDSSDLSEPPSDIGEIPWNTSEITSLHLESQLPLITNPRRSSRRHPDLFTNPPSIEAIDTRLDLLQATSSSFDPFTNVSVNNTNSNPAPKLSSCSPSPAKQLSLHSTPVSEPQLPQPQLPDSSQISQVLRREPSSRSVYRPLVPSSQRSLLPTTSHLSQPSITASQSSSSSRIIQVLQREESSFVSTNSDEVEPSTQSSQTSRTSLPNLKGRDLFDSMIWSDAQTTSIFYMFISSLRQKILEVKDTTETHKFIRILRDGGRLVRNYTQNIDCLEEREGLVTEISRGPGNRSRFTPKTQREARPSEISGDSPHNGGVECVYLHGGLDQLRCGICSRLSEWDEVRGRLTIGGRAPDCPFCLEAHEKRTGRGRRGLAVGRLRPDIVLYGEEHPQAALVSPLVTHDLGLGPDVLLIMGTSLRVHGLKVMVREFAKAIHSRGGKVVFVNRTKPSESVWGDVIDYWVEWDCDEWVVDLRERRGDIWLPQGAVDERRESIGDVKPKKADLDPTQPKKRKYEAPRCTRDEKTNGVYQTFKILDTLRSLEDERGQSSRRQYWVPRYSTSSSTSKPKVSGAELPTTKAPRKSLPSKAQPLTASRVNKRKSLPASAPAVVSAISEDQTRVNMELAKQATWHDIRQKYPSLPESPPEISHAILQAEYSNIPWLKRNPAHPQNIDWKAFPNLLTHPPSGGLEPLHTSPGHNQSARRTTQSPPQAIQPTSRAILPVSRPPPSHSYGTRASRTEGPSVFPSMEGNYQTLKPFAQSVMILETSIESRIPTPPESDPQTPVTNRDMSVGAMLSSERDDNESFKSVREHSTREGTEDMDSVDMAGAQLWHDTVESMEH